MFVSIPGGGASNWKTSVPTYIDLPPVGNSPGDIRETLDTNDLYAWNGSAWVIVAGPGSVGVMSVTASGPLSSSGGVNPNISLTGVVTVPNGGTGDSSFTPYSLIAGGTTSTGNLQSIASVGTSGQVLTSNGASALPTFQNVNAGTVTSVSGVNANGFTVSVANPTTTPAITVGTSITGILYGNGTNVVAAIAGNFPTLNQNTTGIASNITATSNSTLTTLSALSLPTSQLSGNISLTSQVSGILPIANGGTNSSTTLNNDRVIVSSGGSLVELSSAGTSGQILTSNGSSSLPSFQTLSTPPSSISLPNNDILVGNASNVAAAVAMSGDATIVASGALTLATVNSNVGSFGSSTSIPSFTVNAKGLITAASGNVVIAPAGTLTGTTLASNVVTSSLTSTGTITSGTWNGSTITVPFGGTGQTSFTSNSLLIGNGSSALSNIPNGSQYQSLIANASGAASFQSLNLAQSAAVTGILANANTTATSTNTPNTIVLRDGSGNFSAGTITASLTGHSSLDLALTGGTMSGAVNMGSNQINALAPGTSGTDAVNLNQLNAGLAALNPAESVYAATAGSNIPGTYNNGVAGVGATFTTTSTATFTVDGTTPPLNSRILIKDQSSGFQNGIYVLTAAAVGGVSGTVFTRALDYNTAAEMNSAGLIPVINGTVNALSSWQQIATITTVGTDSLIFQEFTANPSLYLLKSNNLSDVSSKAASFNNITPMTTTGDIEYESAPGVASRLPIGSTGNVLTVSGGVPVWSAPATSGTVTSVAITVPSILSVSGSPITTSGTFALSLTNESANTVFAGPVSGSAATPTFRSLVSADIPNNAANTTGTASNITASSNSTLTTLSSLSLPTSQLSGNISLTTQVSGILPVANGGTGVGSFTANQVIIAGSTSTSPLVVVAAGTSGQVLQSNGAAAPSWVAASTGTVTSVGLSLPSIFTISGSPVTTSGTLTATFTTESANTVFAGPATGSAATPTFRALVSADIPNNAANTTGTASNVTSGTFTPGSVIFAGAGGQLAQDNAKFFWDNTNYRLGIGTASPANALYVVGNSNTNVGYIQNTSVSGYSSIDYADNAGTLQLSIGYGNASAASGFTSLNFINANGSNPIAFFINSTEEMRIAPSGRVLINTKTDNGVDQLQVNGTITATGLELTTTPLAVSSGGTGVASFTANQVIIAGTTSTGAMTVVPAGTTGQVLTSNGSGAPTWGTASSGGAMVQIAKTVVSGGSTTSVTFSGISGSYNNLLLSIQARSSNGSQNDTVDIQFNADTGNNYDYAYSYQGGSSNSQGKSSQGLMQMAIIVASSAGSNYADSYTMDIVNYAGTTFYKNISSKGGNNNNNSGQETGTAYGTWKNTAALTSIKLYLDSGSDFVAGSTFILYGIT